MTPPGSHRSGRIWMGSVRSVCLPPPHLPPLCLLRSWLKAEHLQHPLGKR